MIQDKPYESIRALQCLVFICAIKIDKLVVPQTLESSLTIILTTIDNFSNPINTIRNKSSSENLYDGFSSKPDQILLLINS